MKSKNKAAAYAIFGGVIGLHRWYLGQTGKALINIPFGLFLAPITGFYWLLSSEESFNQKYNQQNIQNEILKTLKNK